MIIIRPPPPHHVQQELLVAAEEIGEFFDYAFLLVPVRLLRRGIGPISCKNPG
jgi:hypothetical protein